MIVIMFQSRFARKVESGEKPHTIRLPRKNPIKAGDELSLREWLGKPYRSKQQVLMETVCTSVRPIEISQRDIWLNDDPFNALTLAKNDGFSSIGEMIDWFETTHGLPFQGVLIEWQPTRSSEQRQGEDK